MLTRAASARVVNLLIISLVNWLTKLNIPIGILLLSYNRYEIKKPRLRGLYFLMVMYHDHSAMMNRAMMYYNHPAMMGWWCTNTGLYSNLRFSASEESGCHNYNQQ